MSAENGKFSFMPSSAATNRAITSIKKEQLPICYTNGDSLRLSSFATPRDLTLGGRGGPNKKVFIPNLNVTRNKNANVKTSRDTTARGRGRADRGVKSDRGGRGRGGRGGGNSTLIQTTGVFSEGAGAITLRRSTSSSSYGQGSDDTASSALRKPTLIKRETKIDVKAEAQQVRDILGDSDDDDELGNDVKTDLDTFPIKLNAARWKEIKLEKFEVKTEVKSELIEYEAKGDKTEAIVQTIQSMKRNRTTAINNLFRYPSSVDEIFQSNLPQLFLMQLPDTLPCEDDHCDNSADKTHCNKTNIPAAIDVKQNSTEVMETDSPEPSSQATAQKKPNSNTIKRMEEGQVGKLLRYKSGKCKLVLGESHFDIDMGMETGFLQDLMSISTNREERSGNMINLGPIQAKLTATPDWEYLLKQQ